MKFEQSFGRLWFNTLVYKLVVSHSVKIILVNSFLQYINCQELVTMLVTNVLVLTLVLAGLPEEYKNQC